MFVLLLTRLQLLHQVFLSQLEGDCGNLESERELLTPLLVCLQSIHLKIKDVPALP